MAKIKIVKCDKCGVEYDDASSIKIVEKWLGDEEGYSPCPNFNCTGQLKIIEKEVSNANKT